MFADIVAGLTGVSSCSLGWGDYDNDGDLDLVLAGNAGSGSLVTEVYENDGSGILSGVPAGLTGAQSCSLAWGDYDSDGDLDIALAGAWAVYTEMYRNDGGTFASVPSGLVRVWSCSLAWSDYDNDGDLDLALAGETTTLAPASKIYRNDGGGGFIDIAAAVAPVKYCSLAWGDYDNDGDLDLVLTGEDENATLVTKLYRNETAKRNTVPTAPCALASSVLGSDVILSRNAAFDEETPTPGLSYNLNVWPESGTEDIMPGMADAATGYRRIPALGNAQKRLFWILKGLPSGAYYWTVQAIDSAYASGPWAPEETFVAP